MARLLLAVAAIAIALGMLFLTRAAGGGDGSLTRLRAGGEMRVGYAVEAPYAFVTDGGAVTGESPVLAQAIAERLGLGKVVFRQVEFGRLLDELRDGTIDVVAAGMFITPERAQRVAFSVPTLQVTSGLLVQKGNPRGLDSYEAAIAATGVKLAVIEGAVEQRLLTELGLPPARLVLVPDAVTGRAAVESGAVDGLALSAPAIRWMALGGGLGRTDMAAPFQPPAAARGLGSVAFAFRLEDIELRTAWDDALRQFVGGESHRAMLRQFGLGAAELPRFADVDEVLRAW
jgi:polar amino acid transport system substrate-binding protein